MLYLVLAMRRRERAVAIGSDGFWEDIWSHSWGYMKRRSWMVVLFVARCLKKRIAEHIFDGSGVDRSWR